VSYQPQSFGNEFTFASQASADARADFIGKTYLHLGGAILAFAGLSAVLYQAGVGERMIVMLAGIGQWGWIAFLAGFMAVSWVADSWARSATSQGVQYAGLGLYVVAEAIMFAPLLFIAQVYGGPDVIPTAGVLTLVVFGGLSLVVYMTRYNFSFLGPGLAIAGFAILAMFIVSMLFGVSLSGLGAWLPAGMVVFAGLYILYHTSNVLHTYQIGQHVAASLALFASVALLFWWMIRLVMATRD
jgi:hypothetical protein